MDVNDLIQFFSAIPEAESDEESEFFGAPCFRKVVDGIQLEFSASEPFRDVRMSLQREGAADPFAQYVLVDVEALTIDSDALGRIWLRARSTAGSVLRLSVAPSLLVEMSNEERSPW